MNERSEGIASSDRLADLEIVQQHLRKATIQFSKLVFVYHAGALQH